MKALIALEPPQKYSLLILFTAGLCFWISMTLLLPTLPAYISDVGGTPRQVGLVMGCFAIGLLLSRTWLGHIADRRSRKLVVLIGAIVAGIAPLGYLFIQSISGLMAMRAFHGISIAAFTTGYSALVVDISPAKYRGELIGYMSLAISIGMSVGPALGGFLQTSIGYNCVFLVSASSGLLAVILASQVQENDRHKIDKHQQDHPVQTQRSFWQLLSSPPLLVPALILLLIGLLFGTLISFLPLFIREANITIGAGLFYSTAAIASFVIRLLAGRSFDHFSRGLFITTSLICYAASMLLLSWSPTPTIFLLAAVLEGTGAGILIPLIIALISDRSHAHERGRVYSVCIGGYDLGIALAGPLLGSFAFTLGYRGMFALAGILGLMALSIFLTQSNKNLARSLSFALGQERDLYALN